MCNVISKPSLSHESIVFFSIICSYTCQSYDTKFLYFSIIAGVLHLPCLMLLVLLNSTIISTFLVQEKSA